MANRKIKILIISIILICSISSCNKADLRSMFISYESVNTRFEQSLNKNMQTGYQTIETTNDEYQLFVMSDSHVGSTKNLNTFMQNAVNADATAVVMVGDLTTGKEDDYDVFAENIEKYPTMLKFPIVGNHDIFFNGWNCFYKLFGSTVYYFVVKGTDFSDIYFCLDTGSGTLGDKQLEWFTNQLETKRQLYRHCVVFTHNNLFRARHIPTTEPMTEELLVLLDLFVKYNVNVVITGHDHKKDVSFFGNTTHIILSALLDKNVDAAYLNLIVNDNINYEFLNL